MELLTRAPWRGNVRELENLIEKAVILAESNRLDAGFLEGLMPPAARPPAGAGGVDGEGRRVVAAATPRIPERAGRADAVPGALEAQADLSLEDFDRRWLEAERDYLAKLVEESHGNLSEAARRARVRNRNTLISRLKRHGIRGKGKE
jgi:DNA-binding NtrC family response regulator